MPSLRLSYAAGAVASLLGALVLALTPGTRAQEFDGNYGIGIPEVFLPKYLAFRTGQVASGSPDVMRVKLGDVKGLSRSFVFMAGEAAINLGSGAFSVNLAGLTPLQTYTVWLVNRIRGQDTQLIVPTCPAASSSRETRQRHVANVATGRERQRPPHDATR